jgi:hypothetical protein
LPVDQTNSKAFESQQQILINQLKKQNRELMKINEQYLGLIKSNKTISGTNLTDGVDLLQNSHWF